MPTNRKVIAGPLVLSHDRAVAQYDLHLHTYWSYDAAARVESHFERARELGVRCIAITDHHSLDSLAESRECAKKYPDVVAIPAAELTVTTSIGSVDLLCYGFPREFSPDLQRLLDSYHTWQLEAGGAWSKGLLALGYDFGDADRLRLLESYRPPHVIAVQGNILANNGLLRDHCVERGFIADADAYDELTDRVREQAPFPPYPRVEEVIPTVKASGAKVAIAHPHGYFRKGDRETMDALARECQLDGIECAHHSIPVEYTPLYRQYCVEYGLFSVAGSDSHHERHVREVFARHGGADDWLEEFLGCLNL